MQGGVPFPGSGFVSLAGVHLCGGHTLSGRNPYILNDALVIRFPTLHHVLYMHPTGIPSGSQTFPMHLAHRLEMNSMDAQHIFAIYVPHKKIVEPPPDPPHMPNSASSCAPAQHAMPPLPTLSPITGNDLHLQNISVEDVTSPARGMRHTGAGHAGPAEAGTSVRVPGASPGARGHGSAEISLLPEGEPGRSRGRKEVDFKED